MTTLGPLGKTGSWPSKQRKSMPSGEVQPRPRTGVGCNDVSVLYPTGNNGIAFQNWHGIFENAIELREEELQCAVSGSAQVCGSLIPQAFERISKYVEISV